MILLDGKVRARSVRITRLTYERVGAGMDQYKITGVIGPEYLVTTDVVGNLLQLEDGNAHDDSDSDEGSSDDREEASVDDDSDDMQAMFKEKTPLPSAPAEPASKRRKRNFQSRATDSDRIARDLALLLDMGESSADVDVLDQATMLSFATLSFKFFHWVSKSRNGQWFNLIFHVVRVPGPTAQILCMTLYG